MRWKINDQQGLVRAIKSCGESKDLAAARKIHHHVASNELLRNDRFFANLLVEMYGKCSSLDEARRVFATIWDPNLFSWTIMLTANSQNGDLRQAKKIFDNMPERDSFTWNSILTAYTQNSSVHESLPFFSLIPQRNAVTWSTIFLAYAAKGQVSKAREIFDSMPEKNLPAWNAMLKAYVQNGLESRAKEIFDEMPERNHLTWNSILGARFEEHALTYRLYDRVPARNLITFNSILRALVEYETDEKEVGRTFSSIPQKDIVSWNLLLQGCCDVSSSTLVLEKIPGLNCVSWTAVIRSYARRGQLHEAKVTYTSMPEKDSVAHLEMMSVYLQHGMLEEANALFHSTFERSVSMWNMLLAANAQRGHLEEAMKLFKQMPERGTVAWTSIIQGHAQSSGTAKTALELFRLMSIGGVEPDGVTFLGVLAACSHIGLLTGAREFFISMESYGVPPALEHYSCMVDMLGRSGRVEEAEELINTMPFQPHSGAWSSLMGCCKTQVNVAQGFLAAEVLHQLDPQSSASYVSMYNMVMS